MSQGELNNVTNPAAQSSLNQALSPLVLGTLTAALNSFGDEVLPAPDSGPNDNQPGKQNAYNAHEQDLNSNDVVVMGDNGVKKIPLSQAPPQLKKAMQWNGQ